MIVKLLTEHHLEFLSLLGGCKGSSESTHVKMPHCWKSHATAHFIVAGIVSFCDHYLALLIEVKRENCVLYKMNNDKCKRKFSAQCRVGDIPGCCI